MPADIDLRAEVMKGIDQRVRGIEQFDLHQRDLHMLAKDALTALRHLREIVERHELMSEIVDDGEPEFWCDPCNVDWPCPTLLSLAPDYAPQALAQIEVDRGRSDRA